MTDPRPLVRRVQEALFDKLIHVGPVESVRDGWHEAECETCMWSTTGLERVVEDAAYEHITAIHMAGWDDIIEPLAFSQASDPVQRIRDALDIMAAGSGDLCIDCGLCGRALHDFGGRMSGHELDALVAVHAAGCSGGEARQ